MNPPTPTRDGGWHRPAVARAQRELVERELANDALGKPNAPFGEFRLALQWLVDELARPFSLLEIGCGVGHYGVLCERYAYGVNYFGIDSSLEMMNQAWELAKKYTAPSGFALCDWSENQHWFYDVILISQMAEMTDDPPAVIEFILTRAKRFVILHRLRVGDTQAQTGRVYEDTYCGYAGQNWIWDMDALMEMIAPYGVVRYDSRWERSATLIVEKTL